MAYRQKTPRSEKISARFVFALLLIGLKLIVLLISLIILTINIPYFYIALRLSVFICALKIISSDDNPEYKIPWLLIVIAVPLAGPFLYMMFYSRILPMRYVKRLKLLLDAADFSHDDAKAIVRLEAENSRAAGQARLLCELSASHLYSDCAVRYFPDGKSLVLDYFEDIRAAREFVFLEYYTLKDSDILRGLMEILGELVKKGVDVRLLYDDFGSMMLGTGLLKELKALGICAVPYAKIRGSADGELNNRSHRKMTVIDGSLAYICPDMSGSYFGLDKHLPTRGCALRLSGDAVRECTRLFLIDFGLNFDGAIVPKGALAPSKSFAQAGFCIPFGDGPRPLYRGCVAKGIISAMLSSAQRSIYISSGCFVPDSELVCAIEAAALRGVDVKVVLSDFKKIMLQTVSEGLILRLMAAGVRFYKYTEGALASRACLVDGEYALVGTFNLDGRSLVHNFECGVWLYGTQCLEDIRHDAEDIILSSRRIYETTLRSPWYKRCFMGVIKIFSPLL